MQRILIVLTLSFSLTAQAITCNWTNTLGGDWAVPANWFPNAVPSTTDAATITNAGTYTVTITSVIGVSLAGLVVGGSSGTQTLINGSPNGLVVTNNATVTPGGILAITNGGLSGNVLVQPGGTLQWSNPAGKLLYNLSLTNQGTVTWSGGTLQFGTTGILNSGLWDMTGDNPIVLGGNPSFFTNTGTFRKSAGSANSLINSISFLNQPGGLVDGESGTIYFNTGANCNMGGTFNATAPGTVNFAGTWVEGGAVMAGTGTNQFVAGTLSLLTNSINKLLLTGGNIVVAGTNTFQQAGAITNLTLDGAILIGTNALGAGTLTVNSGGITGQLTVQPSGQLVFPTTLGKTLYFLTLINQGTVDWYGGTLFLGSTVVSNGGLWLMTNDNNTSWSGNSLPIWTNTGILRKSGSFGTTIFGSMNLFNQPGGTVDAESGIILLGPGANSSLGGTLNTSASGTITINGGTWTDAGGSISGGGICQFNGGTFNLRTNTILGLPFNGGDLYITGTNTFQQGGAITNLTLNGATLHGTNNVGGALTFNSGDLADQLTVLPSGQLNLASAATKTFYNFTLVNQGTVTRSGGGLYFGSTVISNGGLWQMTSDGFVNWSGYNLPLWTNSGTVRKTAGVATSSLAAMAFVNQPGGIVEADSGTVALPANTTNAAGTLRLNGGTISESSTIGFTGGTLDGSGPIASIAPTGGFISPGQNGPGLISFTAGLSLTSGATLVINGIGTVAGTQYDQLSVTGAVALGNSTLQVTSLPAVPVGTVFVIIANDGTDPVSGAFNGLVENGLLSVSGQPFRIHYAGGTGNDVTLVRDSGLQLTATGLGSSNFTLKGTGTGPGIYTIQATTDLINWTNIGAGTSDGSGHFTFIDTNAALYSYRFYRTTN